MKKGEIERLNEIVEEIVVTLPILEDISKNNKEFISVVSQLEESVKNIEENIEEKLSFLEESEEAFSALYRRISSLNRGFRRQNTVSIILMATLTLSAFLIGSYSNFLHLKKVCNDDWKVPKNLQMEIGEKKFIKISEKDIFILRTENNQEIKTIYLKND